MASAVMKELDLSLGAYAEIINSHDMKPRIGIQHSTIRVKQLLFIFPIPIIEPFDPPV